MNAYKKGSTTTDAAPAMLGREMQGPTEGADGLDIFKRPLVLTAPGESEIFSSLLPDGVLLLELVSVEAGALHLRDRNGAATKTAGLPPLCIGLVAASQSGLKWLNEASKAFPVMGAFHEFTPRLVDPAAGPLGFLLATEIVDRWRASAEQTTRLAREQARLRATYEHVQNAFAELEGFLSSSGLQPVRLAFENLPEDGRTLGGAEVASIRQLLPVNVLGLCALELHLDPKSAAGGFVATLTTVEDGLEHARWEFGPEDVLPGWMVLPLPRAIIGLQRTPELVLRPRGEAGGLPLFSLGAPQPLPAFRALTASRARGPLASLALRAWSGLPGVRPPVLSQEIPQPATTGPRAHEARIPFSLIRNVKRLRSDWQPNFDVIEPRPHIRGFLCHPGPGGEMTLCALDGLNHSEPSLLSAQATVLNAQAAPIEFGIAFSSRPERHVATLMEQGFADGSAQDFAFTGWRRAVHGRPVVLGLILPGAEGRVYFATRMADQAPEWFGWATFGDLRQVFLGTDPAQSRPTEPWAGDEIVGLPNCEQGGEEAAFAASIDRNAAWLSEVRAMGFDPTSPGIPCPPPNPGIALRRLPAIEISPALKFEARPRVANPDAPPVEFGMAISDLGAGEVLMRVNSKRPRADDSRFVFSGWRRVKPDDQPSIAVRTTPLSIDRANVYLMTRFTGKVRGTPRALAFFSDLSVGASGSQRA